jgi:hypothetical protein
MKNANTIRAFLVFMIAATFSVQVQAQEYEENLARQLANPVAALISVPIHLNYNQNLGPRDDGEQWVLNVQPVIPFTLNSDWNLISRTIFSVVDQSDIFPGAGSQSGLGDTTQSLFFSPAAPTAQGLIWGVGPVFLVPTGTDDLLSTRKWGAGPTAVALLQRGQWTLGLLGNHVWSFAGDDDRADVDATFIQPFLTYTTPTAWSYTLTSESIYNWEESEWGVPVRGAIQKVVRIGTQLASVGGAATYWVEPTANGPEEWSVRATITLLFPR